MDGYTADEELVVSTETHPRPRHRWTSRLGSGSIRRAPSVGQVAAAADVMMLALSAVVYLGFGALAFGVLLEDS